MFGSHILIVCYAAAVWRRSVAAPFVGFNYVNVHDAEKVMIYPADSEIMLGVVMPMTKKDSRSEYCVPGHDAGVQTLEALLFVLDHVKKTDLPFTIGVVVLDSCYDAEIAVESTLKLVIPMIISHHSWYQHVMNCSTGNVIVREDREAFWKIVGIVGSESSEETLRMAYILEMINIPQISHLATSAVLSDIKEYPTFMRTVPADDNAVKALVELLIEFGWTYVSAIYDDSLYSMQVYHEFEVEAKDKKICIAIREQLKTTKANYSKALDNVASVKYSKVVVIFALFKTFGHLLANACERNMSNGYVWLMLDTLSGRNVIDLGDCEIYKNTLGVVWRIQELNDFDTRFKGFRPSKAGIHFNPWMTDYFEYMCNCTYIHSQSSDCTEIEEECAATLWKNYRQDPYLIYITNAVLAYTEALTQLYKRSECPYPRNFSQPLCKSMQPSNIVLNYNHSQTLIELLRQVKFQSLSNSTFQFHNRVDGPPYYSIVYYENSTQWQVAAVYCANCVFNTTLEPTRFSFEKNFDRQKKNYFLNFSSRCSEACKKNQATKYLNAVSLCCWACENCSSNAYVNRSMNFGVDEECVHCESGWYVDENYTTCLSFEYSSYIMSDWLWRIIAVFSFAGLLATIVVAGLLWYHCETPIVKASDLYSNTILLIGCFLAFATPFMLIAYPSNALCSIIRFSIGSCETLIYATIFAKLMRIMFIFSYSTECEVPRVFKQRFGVAYVVFLLLGVELLFIGMWVLIDPPSFQRVNDHEWRTYEYACSTHGLQYLIVFALPLLLAIGSTYFAYRIRKVPNGFNDCRTVWLLVNSNGVLLISFLPLLISDVLSYKYSIFGLSLLVQLNSTAPLCLLFAPKLYVVLLHPERNTKQAVMSRSCTVSAENSNDFGKFRRSSTSSLADPTLSSTSTLTLHQIPWYQPTCEKRKRHNSTGNYEYYCRSDSLAEILQNEKRTRSHTSLACSGSR